MPVMFTPTRSITLPLSQFNDDLSSQQSSLSVISIDNSAPRISRPFGSFSSVNSTQVVLADRTNDRALLIALSNGTVFRIKPLLNRKHQQSFLSLSDANHFSVERLCDTGGHIVSMALHPTRRLLVIGDCEHGIFELDLDQQERKLTLLVDPRTGHTAWMEVCQKKKKKVNSSHLAFFLFSFSILSLLLMEVYISLNRQMCAVHDLSMNVHWK
jgi:hypothetical protein